MSEPMESYLKKYGLDKIADRKDDWIITIWSYIEGYRGIVDTEPIKQTLRTFIKETITLLQPMIDFELMDGDTTLKESIISYLIDKILDESLNRLVELGRLERIVE